jgi:hypothetical protein
VFPILQVIPNPALVAQDDEDDEGYVCPFLWRDVIEVGLNWTSDITPESVSMGREVIIHFMLVV